MSKFFLRWFGRKIPPLRFSVKDRISLWFLDLVKSKKSASNDGADFRGVLLSWLTLFDIELVKIIEIKIWVAFIAIGVKLVAGMTLVAEYMKREGTVPRVMVSFSLGYSTNNCLFPKEPALQGVSVGIAWKIRNFHGKELDSRFLGIMLPIQLDFGKISLYKSKIREKITAIDLISYQVLKSDLIDSNREEHMFSFKTGWSFKTSEEGPNTVSFTDISWKSNMFFWGLKGQPP
ncbi:hypothetical protein V6N13_006302 [Hibiscus sabdariffa]|uniref:Uncharacterized protein n=1 Tax=Hibiscus sabdariffa TaxID=183260 RepID=A0ABR2EQ45_9ROSI